MSRFLYEAFFIGGKEGLMLSLCAFLFISFSKRAGLGYLSKPLFASIFTLFLASLAAMSVPVTLGIREMITRMTGYVFGLFYLLSLGALFHSTGVELLGPFRKVADKRWFLIPGVYILSVIYLLPEMAGSSLYLVNIYSMSGESFNVFIGAGAGFSLALAASYLISRRFRMDIAGLFGLPQLLLFLSLIKLVTGGVRGFAEFSLIPSVQAGLKKLFHDLVHQTYVILMMPDHPLLSMTAWRRMGVLFSDTVALWFSLILMTIPLAIFLRSHFAEEVTVPPEVAAGAQRRRFIKSIRDERFLKSIPVFLFMVFIAGTWFVERSESSSSLYNPKPRPVISDGGKVTVPIRSPGEDLLDGALHKFVLNVNGGEMRLLAMKKPDGTLAVCLDACERCPAEGFAQAKEHVICLYCLSPRRSDTLGQPGGCNPIPLNALVTESDVMIEASEIAEKWGMVKTGKKKEGM